VLQRSALSVQQLLQQACLPPCILQLD
jgi:hypothetical protein